MNSNFKMTFRLKIMSNIMLESMSFRLHVYQINIISLHSLTLKEIMKKNN